MCGEGHKDCLGLLSADKGNRRIRPTKGLPVRYSTGEQVFDVGVGQRGNDNTGAGHETNRDLTQDDLELVERLLLLIERTAGSPKQMLAGGTNTAPVLDGSFRHVKDPALCTGKAVEMFEEQGRDRRRGSGAVNGFRLLFEPGSRVSNKRNARQRYQQQMQRPHQNRSAWADA